MTWILWRLGHWRLGLAGVVITLGVLGATIYTQNHFAIDSLAGLILSLSIQALVVPRVLPVVGGEMLEFEQPRIYIQPARAA